MKWTVNDTVFEGTVEEYKEYCLHGVAKKPISLKEFKPFVKPMSKKDIKALEHPRVANRKYGMTGKKWSAKDKKILNKNIGKKMKDLCTLLDRDENAIRVRMHVMNLYQRHLKEKNKSIYSKNIDRMNYINKRELEIRKENNVSRNVALKQAMKEYNENRKQ